MGLTEYIMKDQGGDVEFLGSLWKDVTHIFRMLLPVGHMFQWVCNYHGVSVLSVHMA